MRATEQNLQEMDSEKAIYGNLYYHFNNFSPSTKSNRL